MLKPLWAILPVLILSILTCDIYSRPYAEGGEDPDGVTYTDVVYSPDGKTVTLYLDGPVAVPNRQIRALSKELAIAGHDFFEVAFYYRSRSGSVTSDIIARTSWELYKDANIRGVRGKNTNDASGVDYSRTGVYRDIERTVTEVVIDPETGEEVELSYTVIDIEYYLPTGAGAAILFVGRKTDKTLLGVGRLTHVNGELGTTIRDTTTSVTFTVAALECGLTENDSADNSFWTNFYGAEVGETNTRREAVTLNGLTFDMFRLRDMNDGGSTVTSGEYHFRTSGADFDDYRYGIILTGEGAYERRQPRYPTADGGFQNFPVIMDDKTVIAGSNNTIGNIGNPFRNPLKLSFDTKTTIPGSVFALAFQIPVCPIFRSEGAGTWYIRSSYDSYWLDLDPGVNIPQKGAGGAILFTCGTPSELSAYQIRVIATPYKYLYSYHDDTPLHAGSTNTNNPNDMNPVNRYFNVNGIVVALEYYNNGQPGEHIRYLTISELGFEIGMKRIRPRVGTVIGEPLPVTLYGLQTIKVIYYHPASGVNHESQFYIIVDNSYRQFTGIPNSGIPPEPARAPDTNSSTGFPANTDYFPGSGIPMRNFLVINSALSAADLGNFLNTRLEYNGRTVTTFVIIFDSGQANPPAQGISYNFNQTSYVQPSNNMPNLYIFVAARYTGTGGYYPQHQFGVHVGRTPTTFGNGVINTGGTTNNYYFGKWPFNDYLFGVEGAANNPFLLGTLRRYDYVVQNPGDLDYVSGRVFHKTYNFSLNAWGMAPSTESAGYEPTALGSGDKYFFYDIHHGRIYNVTVDPEITVHNRRWLN